MRVQPGKLRTITLYLGGDPEKMEGVGQRGAVHLDLRAHPTVLGESLLVVGRWLKEMSFRFPDDDVDCWIEVEE